jgi:universal stress protein A
MPTPRKIFVPTDFSMGANEALKYATDLASHLPDAQIVLMHAIEPMVFPTGYKGAKVDHGAWREKVSGQLKQLAAKTKTATRLPVSTVVRAGRSYQEIARAAKAADADLIVMGSAGYTAQTYSTVGSTAERVARKAHCPVLLVRDKTKETR